MRRARTISLTAAAFVACASAASAATITQTQTFGPALSNFVHTFSFSPFNTALGTLVKVTSTITENLAGTINFANSGSTSATFTAHLTDVANETFLGLTDGTTSLSFTVSGTLPPGGSSGVLPATGTSTATASTTSGLAAFEGGPVLGDTTDNGALFLLSTTGNASVVFTDMGQVIDQLVYTYFIPEPGTLAVLGGALTGLGFARRRRCKA